MTPRRVLLLYYWDDRAQAAMRPAIRHHLHVLDSSPQPHEILYHNVLNGVPGWLQRVRFDAVVLHNTLLCYRWSPRFPTVQKHLSWLRARDCLKVAMPQDEYDHAEVLDEWLADLGISVVFTNFDERHRPLLYPRMHRRARYVKCLCGYIDEANAARCKAKLLPVARRPLDIVFRATHLPYWFGHLGQFKHEFASTVARRAEQLGLVCDISTRGEDAITSDRWFDFLASGKTIIGCEGGTSVLDRRGQIQAQIRALLAADPDLSFVDVNRRMPAGWDDYHFLTICPRHFEAVITRTCQILVQGEYEGVLQPHRHYLPLRRDLGNLDDILHMIKDHALLEATAARAFEEIYESKKFTYASLAGLLDAEITAAPRQGFALPWKLVTFRHAVSGALRCGFQALLSVTGRLLDHCRPRLGIRKWFAASKPVEAAPSQTLEANRR
jgi:hypothetical protein